MLDRLQEAFRMFTDIELNTMHSVFITVEHLSAIPNFSKNTTFAVLKKNLESIIKERK
jgi:hypothetical protein